MRISNRKYAITGASRGLGAALAIIMADAGVRLVLLARTKEALAETQKAILDRTGQRVETLACDLADLESVASAGRHLATEHTDLDGVIHNGAMWLPGSLRELSDPDIQNCVASAAIGALVLTRHLLPVLEARAAADIHTVVSTSGLPNPPKGRLGSVAFVAAKSAQTGFVHGLSNELDETNIRVTAIYPGDIDDVSPLDKAWAQPAPSQQVLSNREVVEAIMFTLNMPPKITVKALQLM